MKPNISVVINTLDAEKDIARAIKSVKWADEIIVCDMYSTDNTLEIIKKMGGKVIYHKRLEFVEPARNFAISKASNDWILILDPDEQVTNQLAEKLVQIATRMKEISFVRIARKNIIFGKWMKASQWWPDYNIRFFKKGTVKWTDEIHRPPEATGTGLDLPAEESFAIIHHNYQSISQFLTRINRYTTVEANQLIRQNYQFKWPDLIHKPLSEFLSRFFANRGFEDGLHGLALSFLQSFSFLIVYLKVWENSSFKETSLNLAEIETEKKNAEYQINYWMKEIKFSKSPFKRFLAKFRV